MMKFFLVSFIVLFYVSCASDDSSKDYTADNEKEILEYIANNELKAQKSGSGLYFVVDAQGSGEAPTASSNVTVAYRGYFTNGSVFDESNSEGISFNLNQVIAGWTEGITYFNEGGSGVLLIPSRLAYGNAGRSGIPSGAVLVFDIKLLSVN